MTLSHRRKTESGFFLRKEKRTCLRDLVSKKKRKKGKKDTFRNMVLKKKKEKRKKKDIFWDLVSKKEKRYTCKPFFSWRAEVEASFPGLWV